MALTELQLPSKTDFYANLQVVATNMKNLMAQWQNMAEFIANMDAADLDSIGVAAGQVRTDLQDFRTTINEMVDFFTGAATTQTNVPETVVDKIRRMK